MRKDIKEFFKLKSTKSIFLLGSGESINNLTDKQWDYINNNDNMAVNNFWYHPTFIPKFNSVELKTYDGSITNERLKGEKWENGWKNVNFLITNDRYNFISKCIGHNDAKIFTYSYKTRGIHPKIEPDVKINADFNPDSGSIYKSYDSSVTSLIHILYLMGYENIVLIGLDMNNSRYFWSSGDPIYGKTHCLFNKDHEHNDPDRQHNASHIKDYIIDFYYKHMAPKGRRIILGNTETALYPYLPLLDWEE